MNSRDRLLAALNHKEGDRVPLDIGSSVVTGITMTAYGNLIKYLGMYKKEPELFDVVQQLANPSEEFLQKFQVDVRNVSPNGPSTWALDIKNDGEYNYFFDEWKIKWRMPVKGGFYYDMAEHPLAGVLEVSEIENFAYPDALDAKRYEGIRERALAVREKGYGVVMSSIGAGLFEYGGWLRGYADFYADLAGEPDMACKVMDKTLEVKYKYWEKVLDIAGDIIDVVQEADDLGSQNSMLISPSMYKEYVKPRQKELFDLIRSKTDAKIFVHTCGSFREVIPDLIEAGVNIINPVQFNAKGMDTQGLKRDFGKDIVFWGGGIDTQRILPRGTVEEVKECVKRQMEILAPGGGFVFNTVHNIQADVPPQNLVAMLEAFKEYANY
ncbi:MAG: hypothetical protein M0T74_01270 [Desulfitobacterium hafniense]|nr:hypothetical protein [Desulfitobacterium hafniense]